MINVTVKFLNGDLIQLQLEDGSTIDDVCNLCKAVYKFDNIKIFRENEEKNEEKNGEIKDGDCLCAIIERSPTEIVIHEYKGICTEYLYNQNHNNKKFKGKLYIGFDLFNKECCHVSISVMSSIQVNLLTDTIIHREILDQKRVENDLLKYYSSDGKCKTVFPKYIENIDNRLITDSPNIITITRSPFPSDPSQYGYGIYDKNNNIWHNICYSTVQEALSKSFIVDLVTITPYTIDGKKMTGNIQIEYRFTPEQIERLTEICNEKFKWMDEKE